MLMKKTVALWFAVACGLAGCSSSSQRDLSSDARNADEAITRAEDAGAKKYSATTLDAAKDDLNRAKVSEDAALRDRADARERLAAAQQRSERARKRQLMRQSLL